MARTVRDDGRAGPTITRHDIGGGRMAEARQEPVSGAGGPRGAGGRRAWLNPPALSRPLTPDDAPGGPALGRRPRAATSRLRRLPLHIAPSIPAVTLPDEETAGWVGRFAHSVHRHAGAFRRYFSIRTNDLAAIIAFNGMIAIVPMFLLVVAIAGLLLRDDQLFSQFRKTVISVFPSQSARDALQNAATSRDNAGWFSVLSLIGFAWVGSSFVATVTRAINSLYDVRGSPFIRSRIRAVFVIVTFTVLLMIAILAGTLPTLFVNRESRYFDLDDLFLFEVVGQIITYAVGLVTAFGLFLIAYRYLPAVKQGFRDVVPGALVAAFGLVLLAQVFPIYVRVYQSLPSSTYLTAFVFVSILVTWSYVLAHVLLIGAWLNARAEERRRLKRSLTITHLDAEGRVADVPIHRMPLNQPPPMPEPRPMVELPIHADPD